MATSFGGKISGQFWKVWYSYVTSLMQDSSLVFMNYGYAHPDLDSETLPLKPEDEENRLFVHLYHQAASFIDLRGKEVLEVSSGHGGGASYITRYLNPKSMTGLERNPKAVAFSRQNHPVPGLSFVEGDAQAIDFPDASFDVVINVEASHSYAAPQIFFGEAARLLKPGGYFLTTDFRSRGKISAWRSQLTASGLKIVKEENITPYVLDSMTQISDLRMAMIHRWVPNWIRGFFKQFAGVQGSSIYESFRSGEKVYMSYALHKEIGE